MADREMVEMVRRRADQDKLDFSKQTCLILLAVDLQEADSILEGAEEKDVAFLVVGDPFGWATHGRFADTCPAARMNHSPKPPAPPLRCSATTHTDLELRARSQGIPVRVVHNASIMNAVGACGLQLYRFGEAVSIVFFTGGRCGYTAAPVAKRCCLTVPALRGCCGLVLSGKSRIIPHLASTQSVPLDTSNTVPSLA